MTDLEAAQAGFFFAIQATLRAMVKSHPDPAAFAAAFHHEHESTISTLLAEATPEPAIEACKTFLKSVIPGASGQAEDQLPPLFRR